MGSEILTLQLGHYSNFVGAHLWNIQELSFQYGSDNPSEINHDVLYREGITNKREVTFTPRLLLVDLQNSLGSLPEQGDLYEPIPDCSKENVIWEENSIEVQAGPSKIKNKFKRDLEDPIQSTNVLTKNYNLEETVNVWSDFLYARFHPRTVEVVKQYQHCNENTPFDVFPLGNAVWKTRQFTEDFTDKIRNYIEECDNFQGFHFLTDCTNAFSGMTSSCLEYIRDEYDRKSVLVFPVLPSSYPNINDQIEKSQSILNDSVRVINLALSFNQFNMYSSMFVPLSVGSKGWRQPGPERKFNNLKYNHTLPYHSSAILAAALDTITLKHRVKNSSFTLRDLIADLTINERKASAASIQIPFHIEENSDLLECLDNWNGPLYQSITPSCNLGIRRLMQHITLRGIKEEKLKKPMEKVGKQIELPAYRCNTIEEMLSLYLSYTTEATANNVTVVHSPLSVKTPFPKFFNNNGSNQQENFPIESIPLLAGIHNGSEIGDMLESLHTEARKIKIAKFNQFSSGGIDKDDYEECLDNLFTLRENYEDNYLL
ncbi:protein misato isoform X1 [Diorhabda carinulata]|uniref:protein misato isoform X1 n=1 Tax=Diorhabda carinulata TaxID=1163345 RepID=UPI0025A1AC4B|nr:protein misato isoform X1 [Diorhabda carinulata]